VKPLPYLWRQSHTLKTFWRILRYVRPYPGYAALNAMFNLLYVLFSLFSLTMVAPFLDLLFLKSEGTYSERLAKGAPDFSLSMGSLIENFYYYLTRYIVLNGKVDALILICTLVVILFFLKNLFRYLALFFLGPLRNHVVKDIRQRLYEKVLRLPLSYFSEERKGDILSRMTSDVHEIEWSIMSTLEVMFRDPFAVLIYLGTLVVMSPHLTLFVAVLFPIAGFIIARVGKSLKRTTNRSREQLGTVMSTLEETLSGLRIIKGFNGEQRAGDRFHIQNSQYTQTMIRMGRKIDLSSPLSEMMGTLVLVVVMLVGGQLVLSHDNELPPSLFITYIIIFSQIIPPARALTTAFYNIQRGIASGDRIYRILDAEETIRNTENPVSLNQFEGSIEYHNVSFAYSRGDQGYALREINASIPKGKTIALVGQSGSGKSTFADLLPRFYDVTEGTITLDGEDIRNIKIDRLRDLMGIVSQEAMLFNDTIFQNISFANPEATEEEVIRAARIANAHDFIMATEHGYKTVVGDRGGKLSGGQRQRISIARAILKNPPILILDEATSALDTESEKLVQEALSKLMENRTSLVIAHRLSTIVKADEILVLHQGRIAERGTHQSLMVADGIYRRLYEMQAFA